MQTLQESLAFWATVLQTLLGLISVIQSHTWLIIVSLASIASTSAAWEYARVGRFALASGVLEIEGRPLDSLNAANLRRHINTTLVVQEARHTARIEGEDLTLTWRYSGYCNTASARHILFSVDGDCNVPFDRMECFAYDLRRDSEQRHKIRPALVGADGITKKVLVPFAEPLAEQEPFDIMLHCFMPDCMRFGLDYVTATLSFSQPKIDKMTVELEFVDQPPAWVRVYERGASGDPELLKDLRASGKTPNSQIYLDCGHRIEAQSARIYVFSREAAPKTPVHTGQS